MKDFMNESKLIDLLSDSDYVPTYEDKDGDWMLVGDVPWEYVLIVGAIISSNKSSKLCFDSFIFYIHRIFVESCKRLRIMKGKEAIGLGTCIFFNFQINHLNPKTKFMSLDLALKLYVTLKTIL